MKVAERAFFFDCLGNRLLGVATLPEIASDIGVLIIVGGPQYRIGSHRQFVQLARALAQAGYPVLRFDVRGMGDSAGTGGHFDAIGEDIACALSAFENEVPSATRFVLWGLCDGASAALMYMEQTSDPRIAGLALLNPWVRSEVSLARTQVKHYYSRRLVQADFWRKLSQGQVGAVAMRDLWGNMRSALRGDPKLQERGSPVPATRPYRQRMAAGWKRFSGRILLILSDNDLTAKEFLDVVAVDPAWQGALSTSHMQRQNLLGADHTLSASSSRTQAEALTLEWLKAGFSRSTSEAPDRMQKVSP